MKKLFFTLAIVLGAITVSAQNSGNMWLGGSVGFNHDKTKIGDVSSKNTTWNILPEFGYFFQDNLAIAGRLGYQHTKKTGTIEVDGKDVSTSIKENSFIINPFLRYTFLKGSIGCLFIDGGIHAEFGKASDIKFTEFGVGIKPGAMINIGNGFAVSATFGEFGYSHRNTKTKPEKTKSDNVDFGLNMNDLSLGITYNF